MHTWTKMRQKLEQEYLAESLRGRLSYFVTTYHAMHDGDEGRVALRLDGAEILKSNFFARMDAQWAHYLDEKKDDDDGSAWRKSALEAIADGTFYQRDFYRAFREFDSQSITESLSSENALVRMLALLDRRTGKRTLEKLRGPMRSEPQWLQMIYYIRMEAERMPLSTERKPMKKGILFDLDGTLWDSSAECTEAWNTVIREQTDRTEQFTVDDMHNFMGRTMEAIAALMFPSLPEAERLHILDLCTAHEHIYLRSHPARLYDGERAVMEKLAETYALGVVSNCQEGYIEIYLDQCGFSGLFCDHECAGRTGMSKGQNIRLVMERQGITDCVYVGDTQGDADAAKEAGIPFIHAAYGFGRPDFCAAAVRDISELPASAANIFESVKEN
ncbi:MAG: HAD family hydrolase [Oscillospiraceae bacterium]|nr:HAD family hydrolase [Oscillospiraceae bacterium]